MKTHGYVIALAALVFGSIFLAQVLTNDQLNRSVNENAFFRMRPLQQLIFSIAWVIAGLIFLLGLTCERKETIFPFAAIFLAEWSLLVVQQISRLQDHSVLAVILSSEMVFYLIVALHVGYTLVILYRVFDSRCKEDEEDIEQVHRPVKFYFGDDPDDINN